MSDGRAPLDGWLERHFAATLPVGLLARNVVLLALAGLVPVLAVYITREPTLWAHLRYSPGAGGAFLRQIISNGLPVVVIVTAIGVLMRAQMQRRGLRPGAALGLDMALRIGGFIGLHVVIYPISALAFGAFGGDPGQALRVLWPTLLQAAGFVNLSGVYLYAVLFCALPVQVAALSRMAALSPPLLGVAALGLIALQAVVLTGLVRLVIA